MTLISQKGEWKARPVQNGTGVSANQYSAAFGNDPDGSSNCGDGATLHQNCYLVPATGFGTLQIINYQNPPRIMQFALKWTFRSIK